MVGLKFASHPQFESTVGKKKNSVATANAKLGKHYLANRIR